MTTPERDAKTRALDGAGRSAAASDSAGNNRQPCFYNDADYCFYPDWLGEHVAEQRCGVHADVLMTDHAHLLVSADTGDAVGRLMEKPGLHSVLRFARTLASARRRDIRVVRVELKFDLQ